MARSMAQETLVHIEIILNTMLEKTNMMEVFLHSMGDDNMHEMASRMDGKYGLEQFNLFASMLHDSNAIRALQLLPNGVTTYTYPYKGNEKAIGDRVLERDKSRDSALFSMRSGLTIVDGPYELLQGGLSLIARNPVYYDNGNFWGFTVIIMSLPDIIEPLGLNDLTRQGFEYRFDFVTKNEPRAVASTLSHHKIDDTIAVSKLLAGRRAILHIIPTSGWLDLKDSLFELIFFLILALIIAYQSTRNKLSSLELMASLEKEKHLRLVTAQAYKEAEQANTAKSDFLSAMSHDLRTPMNAIVGLCSLLLRDTGNQQKVSDYAQKLTASSKHLLGLINDILDMSKIESGKVALNVREFSLASLIEGINTIVRPQARAKRQVFEIVVNQIEHEMLIADDLRLNQILLNLLSNAVKYTQTGGHIKLIVTENEARSNNIARYTFEIVDNGMGMSPDFIQRIYEPFSRADSSAVNHIQGTGLGMTITHNLVKLMGGTIDIESKLECGTTVRINLAIKIKNEEVKDSEFLKSMGISNILLIDDEVCVSKSVSSTMAEAGVSTIHAVSGQDGKEKLEYLKSQGKKIDLILLDLKLHNEDGLDVARDLRAPQSPWRDIPIYILTSFDYTDIEVDAMEIGISGFLMKPLFLSNLKQVIETASMLNHKDESGNQVGDNSGKSVLDGMNILAAEDNELNSEILVELLGIRGATCTICKDGQEILDVMQHAKPEQFDFILMDVQMPVMNGLDATKAIRALDNPYARSIPIIAMTANAFTDDIKASIKAGMNYHISKPIDFDLLEDYVRHLVAGTAPDLRTNFTPTTQHARVTPDIDARGLGGHSHALDGASGENYRILSGSCAVELAQERTIDKVIDCLTFTRDYADNTGDTTVVSGETVPSSFVQEQNTASAVSASAASGPLLSAAVSSAAPDAAAPADQTAGADSAVTQKETAVESVNSTSDAKTSLSSHMALSALAALNGAAGAAVGTATAVAAADNSADAQETVPGKSDTGHQFEDDKIDEAAVDAAASAIAAAAVTGNVVTEPVVAASISHDEVLDTSLTGTCERSASGLAVKIDPELIAEATREIEEMPNLEKPDPELLAEATSDLDELAAELSVHEAEAVLKEEDSSSSGLLSVISSVLEDSVEAAAAVAVAAPGSAIPAVAASANKSNNADAKSASDNSADQSSR